MIQDRQADEALIESIEALRNRAYYHSLYFNEDLRFSTKVEAFSMLVLLFEEVLTSLGLSLLRKREDFIGLYERRKGWYGIDNSISDIYLLGEISTEEFFKLKKFQKDRNDYTHGVFSKGSKQKIEKYADDLFEEHKLTFESLFERLKKELLA